jgi:lipid-A-disaccharide synthase-like uncharacterized protein
MANEKWWIALGIQERALLSARFVVQWLASEQLKRSVVPIAFWWFNLVGGAELLAYALCRRDPVFIAGQAGGLGVYLRNLHFLHNAAATAHHSDRAAAEPCP